MGIATHNAIGLVNAIGHFKRSTERIIIFLNGYCGQGWEGPTIQPVCMQGFTLNAGPAALSVCSSCLRSELGMLICCA